MKVKEKKVYYCDHCGKHYLSEYFANQHELRCYKNPNNQHVCFDYCEYLKRERKREYLNDDWESGYTCVVFTCEKTGKKMYSYKAIKYENRYPEMIEDAERMPLKCNDYSEMKLKF